MTRYSNPKMDDLYKQSAVELDEKKRTDLFIQMNDLAVSDVVEIALVYRTGPRPRQRP